MSDLPIPALKDLAFLYVAAAHLSDHDLASIEMKTIAERLEYWQSGRSRDRVGAVLRSTVRFYVGLDDDEVRYQEVRACSNRLKRQIPIAEQGMIISDLMAIAAADERVTVGEERFIAKISRIFSFRG